MLDSESEDRIEVWINGMVYEEAREQCLNKGMN